MDDDDRLRFLFAKAFERGVPTDACPPAERLLDAERGVLAADELDAVLDHLATCAVCAEAWRLARVLADEGEE